MKVKNEYEICAREYFHPIDSEWQYELSDFVYRSLHKHSGLPVLWTLGFLQDRLFTGSFWFLPEVDLYEKHDDPESKNEINLLCILDSEYLAIEVKSSASMFLNKEGSTDKFVKVINLLRPDVAVLSFEKYCREIGDQEETKSRLKEIEKEMVGQIGPAVKLKILVAQDVAGYDDYSFDLGWFGHRVHKYSS